MSANPARPATSAIPLAVNRTPLSVDFAAPPAPVEGAPDGTVAGAMFGVVGGDELIKVGGTDGAIVVVVVVVAGLDGGVVEIVVGAVVVVVGADDDFNNASVEPGDYDYDYDYDYRGPDDHHDRAVSTADLYQLVASDYAEHRTSDRSIGCSLYRCGWCGTVHRQWCSIDCKWNGARRRPRWVGTHCPSTS